MSEAVGRKEFGLGWALAAALLLHALLLGLSLVVPLIEIIRDVPPQEQRITFSLVEPVVDVDEPLVISPATPRPPTPHAERAAIGKASAAGGTPIEHLPVDPFAFDAAESRRAVEPLDDVEPAPPRPDPESVPIPDTLPEADVADLGAGEAPTLKRTPPQPGSLRGALRDFRSSARSAPLPISSPVRAPKNVFVPDMSQVPVTGSQLGELTFESRDYDWSDYGRQIYMAIWRAWHRRLHAGTDEFERWAHTYSAWYLDHQAGVRFVIERSGRVVGIEVEFPGGCEPLELSAAEALAEVLLPPLPANFPRDQEVVHARFVMRGEVRSMRPVLRRMKAGGLF